MATELYGPIGPTTIKEQALTAPSYFITGDINWSFPKGTSPTYYGYSLFKSTIEQTIENTSSSPITITSVGGTIFSTGDNSQLLKLGDVSLISTETGRVFHSGKSANQFPQTQKIIANIDEILVNVGNQAIRYGFGMNFVSYATEGAVFYNENGIQIIGDSENPLSGEIKKISINSTLAPSYATNRGPAFLNYGETKEGYGIQEVFSAIGSIGSNSQRFGMGVLDVYGDFQYFRSIGQIYATASGISSGTLATTSDGGPQVIDSIGLIDVDNNGFSASYPFGVFNWNDSGVAYEDTNVRHAGSQYVGLTEKITVVSRYKDRDAVAVYNRGGEQIIEAKPSTTGGLVELHSENKAGGVAYSVYVSPLMDNELAAEKSNNTTVLKGSFIIQNGSLRVRNQKRGSLYASNSSLHLLNSTLSGNRLNLTDNLYIEIDKGEDDENYGKPTTFLTFGDDRIEEDPGYIVRLGKASYINAQGVFRGKGEIEATFDKAAFDLAKANDSSQVNEDGILTWSHNGKGYGIASGGVLMKNVQKTLAGNNSHLDVHIPISADEVPDEHFAYQVMRSAVNNLFVNEGIDNIRERVDLEKWEDDKGVYEKYKYIAGKVYINEGKINGGYEEEYYYDDPELVGNQNNIRDSLDLATLKIVPTDGQVTDGEGKFTSYTASDRKVTLALQPAPRTSYNAVYLGATKNPSEGTTDEAEGGDTHPDTNTAEGGTGDTGNSGQNNPIEAPPAGTSLALLVQDGKLGYMNKDGEFKEITVNEEGQFTDENGFPLDVTVTTDNAKALYAWEGEIGEKIFEETLAEKDPPKKPSSTVDAIDSVILTDYYLWRLENETLYQRIGEVRDRADLEGGWLRLLGGKNSLDKGNYYFKHKYYGIQLGFDHVFNKEEGGSWILGAGLTYTHGKTDLKNSGNGKNWLGTLSLYGVKKFNNDAYLDLIFKASRIHHHYTVLSDGMRYISTGRYHTYAYQIGAEVGKKYMLNDEWYIDPQLQLNYGHIKGAKYRTSSDINVRTSGLNSLIGRAGISVGREFKEGSAFVKLDALREFSAKYKTAYSLDSGPKTKTEISLKDTWGEITVGGSYNFRKDVFGFAQVKRSFASDVKQEYRADIGLRYVF